MSTGDERAIDIDRSAAAVIAEARKCGAEAGRGILETNSTVQI